MRAAFAVIAILAGCAEAPEDLDEAQDATEGIGKADAPSCDRSICGDLEASAILFPGNPACGPRGCERNLASDALYIPPTNGTPWGDTYQLGTREPITLGGYSSGRIALLRRLGLVGDGLNAVMLDPSWEDGERDFLGRGKERGDGIVRDWLAADPARTFLLIYSTRSVGWKSYAALADDAEVGGQVRVCSVTEPHLRVPRVKQLSDAFVDPVTWDNGRCGE